MKEKIYHPYSIVILFFFFPSKQGYLFLYVRKCAGLRVRYDMCCEQAGTYTFARTHTYPCSSCTWGSHLSTLLVRPWILCLSWEYHERETCW